MKKKYHAEGRFATTFKSFPCNGTTKDARNFYEGRRENACGKRPEKDEQELVVPAIPIRRDN